MPKPKILTRVPPNKFNSQRIKDCCPVCDHLSITEQVSSPMRALTKAQQAASFAVTYCPRCEQRIRINLAPDSLPQVTELADE